MSPRMGAVHGTANPFPFLRKRLSANFNTYPPIFFGEDGFLPMLLYFPSGPVQQVFYVTHDGGATWIADLSSVS